MARCDYCGSEEDMPFTCTYCKGIFCADHRLPEAHNCPMMQLVRMRRPAYADVPLPTPSKPRILGISSKVELTHLLVAWLVLSLCFSLRYLFNAPSILPLMFVISSGTVGTGFIFHELMHKFSAQRYGFWSEFRLWPTGLIMTVVFSLISGGTFIFAAPGATYVIPRYSSGVANRRQNGLISLAGPLTNVVLATMFLAIYGSGGLLGLVGMMGSQVNLWLAGFNMILFEGMDGQKVISWSIKVWAVVTIPLWIIIGIQMFA